MALNTFFRGESILTRFTPIDRSRTPIPWANIQALSVVVTDQANLSVTFTKTGGTVTEDTGVLSFELTSAHTSAFVPGRLKARFTYQVTDTDFASGYYVDIIEEGITEVFINLQ